MLSVSPENWRKSSVVVVFGKQRLRLFYIIHPILPTIRYHLEPIRPCQHM